jgi:hypothetical protein
VRKSLLTALGNVTGTHLLDPKLFDFKSLSAAVGDISAELDDAIGYHEPSLPAQALSQFAILQ